MRRRSDGPIEVFFLTDPLCPWSWAMRPLYESLRADRDVEVRDILTGWLPDLGTRGLASVRDEWAAAEAKARVGIDSAYWDRVAPRTSLIACAAVKAAELQGEGKGRLYLTGVRAAAFVDGKDVANLDVLVAAAREATLADELFRGDLGVGRYTLEDVLRSIDPAIPLSESVWRFGRGTGLRAWRNLAEDLRNAERQGLPSPAFHIMRGKKEVKLRGLVTEEEIRKALRSVR